ncbi:hypothetical protein L7F22_050185 [Adiantum nelumboides]|nr:hypothetical protein [Adiantum nelumboides]
MPPKSIWRGPNAQHFTLVHRSQQDPLLHDAEASNRVLKSTPKRNENVFRQGQNKSELERQLGSIAEKERKNVGEAANYGIYYDDTEYDYMQHLRSIGGKDNSRRGGKDEEKDEEVIMLEAPAAKKEKGKAKATDNEDVLEFKKQPDAERGPLDLPSDVLPSDQLLPRTFEQDKEEGIRPDMDPHLRQVLEALEDDAFLMRTARGASNQTSTSIDVAPQIPTQIPEEVAEDETEDIDDFFGEIVKGGELEEEEEEPEWRQLPPGGEESIWLDPSAKAARELLQLKEEGKGVEDLSLESRVALFKKAAEENKKQGSPLAGSRQAPSSVGSKSIFGDKGASRRSRHAGAKARLASSFYAPSIDGGATAFSMSSSAMERNQGLSKLDEQFARMERIYEQEDDDEDEEEEEFEEHSDEEENDVGGPEDVDAIFDEFLSKNEIVGNKLRERLGDQATTPIEKVDMIRKELGEMRSIDRKTYDEAEAEGLGPKTTVEELISRDLAQRTNARQEWDVETIQTTKTNLENHPRTIAAAESVAPSRISRIVPPSSFLGGVNGSNAPASLAGTDRMARIKIDPRTGKAVINGYINIGARQARRNKGDTTNKEEDESFSSPDEDPAIENDSGSEAGSDDTTTESTFAASRMTVKRDRNESKEEKKARKQAAKEEKQNRKSDKAQRKAQFKAAMQQKGGHPSHGNGLNATTVALR